MVDDTKTEAGRKVLKLKRTVDVDRILASRQARVRQGVEIEIRGDAAPTRPVPEERSHAPQKSSPRRSGAPPVVHKPSLTEQEQEARKEALAKASAFLANSRVERREREEQRLRAKREEEQQKKAAPKEETVAVEAPPPKRAPSPSQPVKRQHFSRDPFKQQQQRRAFSPGHRPRQQRGGGGNHNQRRDYWQNRQQSFQAPVVAERASLKGKTATKTFKPPSGVQKTIDVSNDMTVRAVALVLARKGKNIIDWLRDMGVKAGEQTVLDVETVCMVIEAMGHIARVTTVTEERLLKEMLQGSFEKTDVRPPVLAIMGHVDHGKTTLVDALCNTRRVSREAGGINQDVRGYQTELTGGGTMTLVDTPVMPLLKIFVPVAQRLLIWFC